MHFYALKKRKILFGHEGQLFPPIYYAQGDGFIHSYIKTGLTIFGSEALLGTSHYDIGF